ncbi:MAG: ABC transporter permease [Clostridiales bacterium]|jgi:ABC-2 type transport system permease protein|nr:ABC transporter permease [Clostridiales bacterium]
MNLALIATGNELRKIFARKKYWITLMIQLAVCFLFLFFASADSFAYMRFGISLDVPSMPQILLNMLCTVVLPLNIFMLGADLFANEIENGTIRAVLLRPISRFKIYLSKIAAIAGYVLLNLTATFLVIVIAKIVSGGALPNLTELLLSYLLALVPMIVFAGMAAFVSLLLANSSMAMFCSLILYIVMQGVTLWDAQVGAVFFTSHLGWYKMFLGLSIDYATVLNIFFLFLSTGVLFAIGGYILFERREV